MGFVWYDSGRYVGTWRSQVAHSAGGRVVAGSNPAVPTYSRAPRGTRWQQTHERLTRFGDALSTAGHHRFHGPHRRVLLRWVRAPGLPLQPVRGRLLRPPANP